MRLTPRTAISTPDVGVIILVNPSPNWKAITVACFDNPIKSEKGAMIGMVRAALALPEGMIRLISVWITYIMPTVATCPSPSIPFARL